MNLEFIFLGGYGQFVWPAFIFSFTICLMLYLKTKRELKRQEKIFFNEYRQLHTTKIKTSKGKNTAIETLSASTT